MSFFRRASLASLPVSSILVAVPALGLLLTLQACMGAMANSGDPTCADGTDCAELTPVACEDDGYNYGYGYGYGGKGCRD